MRGPDARRLVPVCAAVVAVVWAAAIGFRLGWWRTGNVDRAWDALMRSVDGPVLHGVAQVLAVIGTGVPAVLTAVALAILVGLRRGAFWAVAVVAIASADSLEVAVLKAVARRLRPDVAFGVATAFPSGHTAFAAVLATLVAALLLEGRWRLLAAAYPVLMGWSRTQLHAHWLSDVLAGAAVGAATTVLLLAAASALQRAMERSAGTRPLRAGPSARPRLHARRWSPAPDAAYDPTRRRGEP